MNQYNVPSNPPQVAAIALPSSWLMIPQPLLTTLANYITRLLK